MYSHVLKHHMTHALLDLNLYWLATRIPEGAYELDNMPLLLLKMKVF
jgi:hypothetical protein